MAYISGYEKIIAEYFDYADTETRKSVVNINEADQSKVLYSLTSKLYNNIIEKVDDIDYGNIPNSRGDITKVENYDKMIECLDLIQQILIEYNQPTTAVKVITDAVDNIRERQPMFDRAFKLNIELPIVLYCNIVLSIISATSFMIASCIEFVKTPNTDSFDIIIDKTSLVRTKENLLFENLDKFNHTCTNGSLDKTMDYIIKNNVHNLVGIDSGAIIIGTIALTTLIVNIIPILREMIFFFFYTRTRISDYFEIQSELLQMNIEQLKYSETTSPDKTKAIVAKQSKIVVFFKKISNALVIDNKSSEVKAAKDIADSKKQYKSKEVLKDIPDSAASSLF